MKGVARLALAILNKTHPIPLRPTPWPRATVQLYPCHGLKVHAGREFIAAAGATCHLHESSRESADIGNEYWCTPYAPLSIPILYRTLFVKILAAGMFTGPSTPQS
jgi:hypothetical protein